MVDQWLINVFYNLDTDEDAILQANNQYCIKRIVSRKQSNPHTEAVSRGGGGIIGSGLN